MLLYSIYDVIKHQKEKWLLVFIVPFTIIFIIDEVSFLFLEDNVPFMSLDSYGIFLIAVFLFYSVTYKLITAPKEILPPTLNSSTNSTVSTPPVNTKYKLSNLSETEIEIIKKELHRLMIEEQLFKNPTLTANETAKKIGITRQRLSEVLNVHLGIRFQDYLNQHRVEAFIKCLYLKDYENFTLLGIATEVGFKSKSTFNAAFKKIKGMTPSQYKKLNQQ
jgi:AraC-like DNA-binding protein